MSSLGSVPGNKQSSTDKQLQLLNIPIGFPTVKNPMEAPITREAVFRALKGLDIDLPKGMIVSASFVSDTITSLQTQMALNLAFDKHVNRQKVLQASKKNATKNK